MKRANRPEGKCGLNRCAIANFDAQAANGSMMQHYDPLEPPDPEEWISLDEQERIQLVEDYHRRTRIRLPNVTAHAVIHAVVENQIAFGDETPVRRTIERLMAEGLDRHDAIHAVGSVLAGHIYDLLRQPVGAGFKPAPTKRACAVSNQRGDYPPSVSALFSRPLICTSKPNGSSMWRL